MKRITLFVIGNIFFMTVCAQEQKTPTKLETMDWIAGKLKQYMRLPKDRTFMSYSNGIFIYEKRYYNCERRLVTTSKNTIDLNKVADYTICSNKPTNEVDSYGSNCSYSEILGQNLIYTTTTNHLTGRFTTSYDNKIRIAGDKDADCDNDYNNSWDDYTLFNFDLEAGLLTRMQKALKALIKYNTIKPGEAY